MLITVSEICADYGQVFHLASQGNATTGKKSCFFSEMWLYFKGFLSSCPFTRLRR